MIKRTGWKPRTAERGYGEAAVEDDLHNLGIRNVLIPRRGRPSKARQDAERGRAFRRTVKWRTGCKGRISHLKRNSGWARSLIDGTEGAQIWTAHGVFPHNLAKTRSDRLTGRQRPTTVAEHPHPKSGPTPSYFDMKKSGRVER